MAIRFHNSLTKKLEDFIPIRPGHVSMYSCGPTVYNYVHLGNLRAFLFVDLLKRFLTSRGFKVNHVMNITDVDDKTIRGSQETGTPFTAYTEFYTQAFLDDCRTLNCEPPSFMPKATAEIEGMIALIQTLLDKGHAYIAPNRDVYFRVESFANYGELADLSKRQLKFNADGRLNRGDEYSKENVSDFALWKAHHPTDGDISWPSPFGPGRPGWHIECSAMAHRHLGTPIDIHCGGIDLLFPHHTNEIAQSECGYGHRFVNYWMHNAHLLVNGRKMSKSLGNFLTLRDLLQKGHDPLAIRLELLKTHYRQELDFREDNLKQHATLFSRFKNVRTKLAAVAGQRGTSEPTLSISDLRHQFLSALDDDLNISAALAIIHAALHELSSRSEGLSVDQAKEGLFLLQTFDTVLGVFPERQKEAVPQEVLDLVAQRNAARISRDFTEADRLRNEITKLGYQVLDSGSETKVSKV